VLKEGKIKDFQNKKNVDKKRTAQTQVEVGQDLEKNLIKKE